MRVYPLLPGCDWGISRLDAQLFAGGVLTTMIAASFLPSLYGIDFALRTHDEPNQY